MKTNKRTVGDLGEDIACKFLMKHGFEIVERNYLRKWGEIDIVARKAEKIHFIEVKSVTYGTSYMAEENMHPWKLKRLGRVIQTYLLHQKLEGDWQLDLITVELDIDKREARVELMENIVI